MSKYKVILVRSVFAVLKISSTTGVVSYCVSNC